MNKDEVSVPGGVLEVHYNRREDLKLAGLPNSPIIWIFNLEAKPKGKRLLRKHASVLVEHVKARFGPLPVFLAAGAHSPDSETQPRLESYYRSCGFKQLVDSTLMKLAD
jgi:hypothetical protein